MKKVLRLKAYLKTFIPIMLPLSCLQCFASDIAQVSPITRQIIKTTELSVFGKKRFEIPIDVEGKKWIRFAA